MDNQKKFFSALRTLKSDVEATIYNDILTEEDFNKVIWTTGEDNGIAITTTSCPHSEITLAKVKEEMDKL